MNTSQSRRKARGLASCAVGAASALVLLAFAFVPASADDLADAVAAAAVAINRKAPIRVDEQTVLRRATADGHTLAYIYDFEGAVADDMKNSANMAVKAAVAPNACPALMLLLKAGATANFWYTDVNRFVFFFSLTRADCR